MKQDVSVLTVPRQTPRQRLPVLPCHVGDPDLWFADTPAGLEVAKTLCVSCPIRRQCLAAALQRAEPWGVWGGEIFDQGSIVSHKRPRGRPRHDAVSYPAMVRPPARAGSDDDRVGLGETRDQLLRQGLDRHMRVQLA